MRSALESRYIGIGCGLNNWNSSVDGIGIVIVKIKYLSNKKYCILAKGRTIEKRDVDRYGFSLLDLKSRKVSGSNIGCNELVAAWLIASISRSRSKRKD